MLTEIAYERAEHFTAGFLCGYTPKQAQLIRDIAFERFKYDEQGISDFKYKQVLIGLAHELMCAVEDFEAAR